MLYAAKHSSFHLLHFIPNLPLFVQWAILLAGLLPHIPPGSGRLACGHGFQGGAGVPQVTVNTISCQQNVNGFSMEVLREVSQNQNTRRYGLWPYPGIISVTLSQSVYTVNTIAHSPYPYYIGRWLWKQAQSAISQQIMNTRSYI